MLNPLSFSLPVQLALGAVSVAVVTGGVVLLWPDTAPNTAQQSATQVISPDAQTTAQSTPADPAPAPQTDIGPLFDLVRVDDSGSAVIAGTAQPGAQVQVTLGSTALDTITADQNGAFVSLVQLPQGETAQTVGLRQLMDANRVVVSTQTVLIVPQPIKAEPAAPTVVLANSSGAQVLQSTNSASTQDAVSLPLSLEAISYDQRGEVVLAGKAGGQQFVRVYVDNAPVKTQSVLDDGSWRVTLPDITQGVYTLRVDEIDETGIVSARVESPFQRVAESKIKPDSGGNAVVVQPGHTLWALAQDRYGDGVKYVQILDANRSLIRDADLIYPGQIFEIPK